ncbi:Hypothetical predicted protein, partial [Pelobates cultripes]
QFPNVRQKKDSCLQKRKRPEGELTGSTSNEKQSSPASKRRTKNANIVPGQEDERHLDIKGREQREAFYQLLDDAIVQAFLYTDEYFKSSDKYLLAMVMTYFQRAGLKKEECNRDNFFTA